MIFLVHFLLELFADSLELFHLGFELLRLFSEKLFVVLDLLGEGVLVVLVLGTQFLDLI